MVLVAAVARRLCYVVTRAGLVALVHLCFTHAMTLVSTFAEQLGSHPILDTVGFTSFVNLLLFSCYLVYYASCYVYQSMVDPPSGCVGRSAVMLLEACSISLGSPRSYKGGRLYFEPTCNSTTFNPRLGGMCILGSEGAKHSCSFFARRR